MGNLLCMGLFLDFDGVPTPRLTGCGDHADHRSPARMDVDVFDSDLLLALKVYYRKFCQSTIAIINCQRRRQFHSYV